MASSERKALLSIFGGTGGPAWWENGGWNTSTDISEWHGVNINDKGRVVALNMRLNNLRGSIAQELGALSKLKELDLSENKITGSIPPVLRALNKLGRLDLSRNQITGSVPPELGALSKLRMLYLSKNNLIGRIPPELGTLIKMKELNLSMNHLTGPMPKELAQMGDLKYLHLNNNKLDGPIPPVLESLGKLEKLDLSNNLFIGAIPPELGSLGMLEVLHLSDNKLTGRIPPELGALSKLAMLCLSKNEITGYIPPELGALRNLSLQLDLSRNQLTGTIPRELLNIRTLRYINCTKNHISGPSSLKFNSDEERERWKQILEGQTVDEFPHSLAWHFVESLTALWHFWLPVFDDATDLWLLLETFGGRHWPMWWICLVIFVVADIERVYTALYFIALTVRVGLNWVSRCFCWGERESAFMSFMGFGQRVDLNKPWWLMLDSLMWTLLGSRSRSSTFMEVFGMAGQSTGNDLRESGLGVHAIDVILFYHPFRYLGESIMNLPFGRRRGNVQRFGEAKRRDVSMVRAVGETLCVDPLFLAWSVVSGGWDDNVTRLAVFSALFSVLELVTELQYYISEAETASLAAWQALSAEDVEVGVRQGGLHGVRPIEISVPVRP